MDSDRFIKEYLQPSGDSLDRRYTLPPPDIRGLEKTGDFIVQSRCNATFSTNVIARFESPETGFRFVEVYKSSQNRESGKFVRLVGTMALVKRGYPFLFLDAAVTNIDLQSGESAPLGTRVAIHMPQATDEGRTALMEKLSLKAGEAELACGTVRIEALPAFWGPLWHTRAEGLAHEAVAKLRTFAWQAYQDYCAGTEPEKDFDYQPVQVQMILKNSRAEYGQFQRMGLDVPVEVQAAFFSVLCTGL